jgi:hypothetical protein
MFSWALASLCACISGTGSRVAIPILFDWIEKVTELKGQYHSFMSHNFLVLDT